MSAGKHYFDCEGTILATCDSKTDWDDFELGPNPDHIYFAVSELEQKHTMASNTLGAQADEIKVRLWVSDLSTSRIPLTRRFVLSMK